MYFLYPKKSKNSIFDKTTQIDFFDILSEQLQDFIIFYNFLMSLDIWSTPTPIFMGSKSVPKIAVFYKINHVVVKRGVIHEEFLWKLFFRKVWILLNISIYYHFFISHIVFNIGLWSSSPKPVFEQKFSTKSYPAGQRNWQ